MSKPLIALLSRDTRLICELPARGKGRFRFAVCEAIEEAEEFFARNRAAAFVADFRETFTAEAAESRWLEGLRRRFADMAIVLLTPAGSQVPAEDWSGHCSPEPQAGCGGIAQLRCGDDRQTVNALLACLPPGGQTASSSPNITG